jgi:hypothetical protein
MATALATMKKGVPEWGTGDAFGTTGQTAVRRTARASVREKPVVEIFDCEGEEPLTDNDRRQMEFAFAQAIEEGCIRLVGDKVEFVDEKFIWHFPEG